MIPFSWYLQRSAPSARILALQVTPRGSNGAQRTPLLHSAPRASVCTGSGAVWRARCRLLPTAVSFVTHNGVVSCPRCSLVQKVSRSKEAQTHSVKQTHTYKLYISYITVFPEYIGKRLEYT